MSQGTPTDAEAPIGGRSGRRRFPDVKPHDAGETRRRASVTMTRSGRTALIRRGEAVRPLPPHAPFAGRT